MNRSSSGSAKEDAKARHVGFTLVEMIAVMTIIAIFAGMIGFAFMRGGGQTVGLQSAQSSVVSLLALVRGQAATSGRNAALLVNADPDNPQRYLRYLIPVLRPESGGGWVPIKDGVYLPDGCYVVPFATPTGALIESGESWTNLNSSRLATSETLALLSSNSEDWIGVEFTPFGSPTPAVGTGISSRIVLATGRRAPPGVSPPIVLTNPENVRGVTVSAYGFTQVVNSADGF